MSMISSIFASRSFNTKHFVLGITKVSVFSGFSFGLSWVEQYLSIRLFNLLCDKFVNKQEKDLKSFLIKLGLFLGGILGINLLTQLSYKIVDSASEDFAMVVSDIAFTKDDKQVIQQLDNLYGVNSLKYLRNNHAAYIKLFLTPFKTLPSFITSFFIKIKPQSLIINTPEWVKKLTHPLIITTITLAITLTYNLLNTILGRINYKAETKKLNNLTKRSPILKQFISEEDYSKKVKEIESLLRRYNISAVALKIVNYIKSLFELVVRMTALIIKPHLALYTALNYIYGVLTNSKEYDLTSSANHTLDKAIKYTSKIASQASYIAYPTTVFIPGSPAPIVPNVNIAKRVTPFEVSKTNKKAIKLTGLVALITKDPAPTMIAYDTPEFEPGKIHLIKGKSGSGKSVFSYALEGKLQLQPRNTKTTTLNMPEGIKFAGISQNKFTQAFEGEYTVAFKGKEFTLNTQINELLEAKNSNKYTRIKAMWNDIVAKPSIGQGGGLSGGQRALFMMLTAMSQGRDLIIDECLSAADVVTNISNNANTVSSSINNLSTLLQNKNAITQECNEEAQKFQDLQNVAKKITGNIIQIGQNVEPEAQAVFQADQHSESTEQLEIGLRGELFDLIKAYMRKNPDKYCFIIDHNFLQGSEVPDNLSWRIIGAKDDVNVVKHMAIDLSQEKAKSLI